MKDKTGRKLTSGEISVKINHRVETIFLELMNYALHIIGIIPSHHIRRFFYRSAGMKIGLGSSLHEGARFYNPVNIEIGDDTIIGEFVVLDCRAKLLIGNHVAIASEVMIYNCQHDINSE